MFGSTAAWGLDIGSSSIKAVKLRRTGSGAEVTDFDVIEIEHSDDESTRDMRNAAAVAELVRRKKFGTTPVVASVAGNQVFFRPFNLPAVGERKVPEIVRYEARQQVPFPLEEVVWDYRTAQGGSPGELAVSLVAIRKEIVERLLSVLREQGLNVAGLTPSPVAVLNYVHYDVQPMETSLILDAGAKVTDFVVLHGGSFWFRPLPVAGADLTHVFEQKFRMPFAEAENLKTKLAESKQYEKMFQVIEPTLRSLAGEIQRTSGYYLSLQRNVRISRIFGLGHTFRLPGMVDFLSQNIETELEMLSTPQRVAVSSAIDTTWFAEEFPGMGPALGLALQGLGLAHVEMGLLPDSLVREKQARTRRKLFIVAAAAIAGLVVSEYVAAKNETAGLDGEEGRNAKMEKRLKETAARQTKVRSAAGLIKPRRTQLERWGRIGMERGRWGEVAAKLLAQVDEHNRKLPRPAGQPAAGEMFLSDLYVSRQSPLKDPRLSRLRSDPHFRGLLGDRTDGRLYVVAGFECRGEKGRYPSVEPVLKFEKALHEVKGFRGLREVAGKLRPGEKDEWKAGGDVPQVLEHFTEEWRKGRPPRAGQIRNAWVFRGLWLYEPEAPEKAAAAEETTSASGGGEKG